MTREEQATRHVAAWLDSCQTRFKNMYDAGLDMNGWPKLQQVLDNFQDKGTFSVGEIQYLFNRTHPLGHEPKYNTYKGYDRRYGDMMRCPIQELIDSKLVNWRSGSSGVMQPGLQNAIKTETRWEFRMGNLRPQVNTTYEDLFA